MIRAFIHAKNPDKAIEFYGLMRARAVELNRFTFLFVLKAYGLKPSYQEGKTLHGMILKFGHVGDLFIHNALINMYSKCGDVGAAFQVFDEMRFDSTVVHNTMILSYFAAGNIENGRKLFDEMPKREIGSWNAVIGGYCKLGRVDIARSLFDEMTYRDLISWGTMISGYAQSGRAMDALKLFKEMQFLGVDTDSVTMTSVLAACAQIGALDMGRWAHAYVNRKQLTREDLFLSTSLVDMYAKCGCMETAFKLFRSLKRRNLCTWNAMLCGLAVHGQGYAALELFKEMELSGVNPDEVTFIAVLSACNHVGSVDEGWKQFKRMQEEFKISPKIEHYGCIVDLLGRRGLIVEAKEVIRSMPMKPNVVIWGALLNACRIHGYTDISQDLMGYLQSLGPEDNGCQVLLSNILAANNKWGEVEKTRKMVRGVEKKKIPGCSSIEVGREVHEFFVQDRLNSNWVKVSEVVERLSSHLEIEGYMPNLSLALGIDDD